MNQREFDQLVDQRCVAIKQTLASKAKEYAKGDRLHNFKRAAQFMQCAPESACFGFAMKHFTSVADLVNDVEEGFTPENLTAFVNEKVGDAINYLILLEALLKERAQNPSPRPAVVTTKKKRA